MTAAQELSYLETSYEAWVKAGCPQSYTHEGRVVTRASADWMSKRIDQLRALVARSSSPGMAVANFRRDT